jgi:Arabinose efflux permease
VPLEQDMEQKTRNPWSWIPSLYFAEGLPYVAVMVVAGIMYKRLGLANDTIAMYTGWLNLPWVIKPLWSPFVEIFKTKRWWIVLMQLVLGVGLAGVAFSLHATHWVQMTFAFLFLVAFSSATHDIACDGFYMLALPAHNQAAFMGIRNTSYRIAMITGQGLLVMLAGYIEQTTQNLKVAWMIVYGIFTVLFLLLLALHKFSLPRPDSDHSLETHSVSHILREFGGTFVSFFKKKHVWGTLLFILFYRFGEAQITVISKLFMLDQRSAGGLGLSTEEVGFLYGVVSVVFLLLGGILGGVFISRNGLKYWLWPMGLMINVPHLTYVYLSQFYPTSLWAVSTCVAIEQFGYGFGFVAFMVYLMYFSEGKYKTAHYAICTGIMALGMMLPTMVAGKVQQWLGYPHFFLWVMFCTVFTFIGVAVIKVDKDFGKRKV